MRTLLPPLILLAFLQVSALGAFTDFSDYTENETFILGETFESLGLSFEVVDLFPLSSLKFFAGLDHAFVIPGPGMEFLLPAGVQEISFPYESGAGRKIVINGVEPVSPSDASFSFLDGTTVAGVSISTTVDFQSGDPDGPFGITGEIGTITMIGPISSFSIAGGELKIDDIFVRVPEPTTAALFLVASVIAMSRRRQRNG